MENNTAIEQVYQLIHAMDDQKGMFYIITMANADAGGRVVNEIWQKEGKKRENWLVVPSLGVLQLSFGCEICKAGYWKFFQWSNRGACTWNADD